MDKYINLRIPEYSYFFGFAQTDGSLSSPKKFPNKGKFQIEINGKDLHILKSFKKLFPLVYSSIKKRVRNTNFKNNHTSYVLVISDKSFRDEINTLGIPYGRKSEIISSPKTNFRERDYIRGLIDGDGSLGMTARNVPFVSFTVKSEKLKDYLVDFVEKLTSERKKLARNKRDSIYNIMINREKAQKIIKYLYYPECLCLKRKLKSAKIALNWKRPKGLVRILNKKFWDKTQDEYVLNHRVDESCNYLKRTRRSIGMRLWRLRNNKTIV
jgi:hypothetical protein